jgi:hypothetical protein
MAIRPTIGSRTFGGTHSPAISWTRYATARTPSRPQHTVSVGMNSLRRTFTTRTAGGIVGSACVRVTSAGTSHLLGGTACPEPTASKATNTHPRTHTCLRVERVTAEFASAIAYGGVPQHDDARQVDLRGPIGQGCGPPVEPVVMICTARSTPVTPLKSGQSW